MLHALRNVLLQRQIGSAKVPAPTLRVALFYIKYTPSGTSARHSQRPVLSTLISLVCRLHLWSRLKSTSYESRCPMNFVVTPGVFSWPILVDLVTLESVSAERTCTWLPSLWMFDIEENCHICMAALVFMVKKVPFNKRFYILYHKNSFVHMVIIIEAVCFT